jgi:16S rRNA (cytosine967-C5)-methyltransferase
MHHRIRDRAARVLWHAERDQRFVEHVLAAGYGRGLKASERALLTELVYGTVRWRSTLDHVIAGYRALETLRPQLRSLLRLALFQMGFLDRALDRVAVASAVDQARRAFGGGGAGLANAILRRAQAGWERLALPAVSADPRRDVVFSPDTIWRGPANVFPDPGEALATNLALRYSLPVWLVEQWIEVFGENRARELVAVQNSRPGMHCWVDPGAGERAALRAALRDDGIVTVETLHGFRVVEGAARVVTSRPFEAGQLLIQDETASAVVPFLEARSGDLVLELGAAPGGKTVPLARAVGRSGRVVAVDRSWTRMRRLGENLARFDLVDRVDAVVLDGAALPEGLLGRFDRVLVDAPCSNTGVLARRHEARWRLHDGAAVTSLVRLQRALLKAGLSALQAGGSLVYATCSIQPEENREVVDGAIGDTVSLVAEELSLPDGIRDGGYRARLVKQGPVVSK